MKKILRRIGASLIEIIMVPMVIVGILFLIASIELQPENMANLTSDIVADTLSKDNLKKITVSDVEEYLPSDIKEDLPPDATMEEVVPVAFNSITGIESYVSLETVEQMIDDDVIRDLTLAVINEEDYDFVELTDKYSIPMEDWQREELAKLETSTIKNGLNDQGYNVDEIYEEQISGETASTSETNSSNNLIMDLLTPGIAVPVLVAIVAVFYLLLSLVFWNLKTGLIWWGAGICVVGVALLIVNGFKFELANLALDFANVKINSALIEPAVSRLMRPVLISGIIGLLCGAGAMVGGKFWNKK